MFLSYWSHPLNAWKSFSPNFILVLPLWGFGFHFLLQFSCKYKLLFRNLMARFIYLELSNVLQFLLFDRRERFRGSSVHQLLKFLSFLIPFSWICTAERGPLKQCGLTRLSSERDGWRGRFRRRCCWRFWRRLRRVPYSVETLPFFFVSKWKVCKRIWKSWANRLRFLENC